MVFCPGEMDKTPKMPFSFCNRFIMFIKGLFQALDLRLKSSNVFNLAVLFQKSGNSIPLHKHLKMNNDVLVVTNRTALAPF